MSELAEPWSERRWAAEALLREVLGQLYPLAPAADDPLRLAVERSLVRRATGPFARSAQEAADLLQERVWAAFPRHVDDLRVEWRQSRGQVSLRLVYGWGPAWLPMRTWADNYAAVTFCGLYRPLQVPGAEVIADYILLVPEFHCEFRRDAERPWSEAWAVREGPWCDIWQARLGPPEEAPYGQARDLCEATS